MTRLNGTGVSARAGKKAKASPLNRYQSRLQWAFGLDLGGQAWRAAVRY